MCSRIIIYTRRHHWALLMLVTVCISGAIVVISWPPAQRYYAAEMMVRAVKADDPDLEASLLLASAIDRVNHFEAQNEAVAKLIPLLDADNNRERERAGFCILYLNVRPRNLVAALIAIYRNPVKPPSYRIEIAGLLKYLSPRDAQECGAAAVLKEYLGRRTAPMNGNRQIQLAQELLRREDAKGER